MQIPHLFGTFGVRGDGHFIAGRAEMGDAGVAEVKPAWGHLY